MKGKGEPEDKERTDIKNGRLRYKESSESINRNSWKPCAWNWKQQTQKKIPGSSSR